MKIIDRKISDICRDLTDSLYYAKYPSGRISPLPVVPGFESRKNRQISWRTVIAWEHL